MLTAVQNEMITMTGPGTPMGEVFRRYWQPVALSEEITPGSKPIQVRVMSEDLVLFRDVAGRPGLLGVHCSHRRASLAYGRGGDGGSREWGGAGCGWGGRGGRAGRGGPSPALCG